MLTTLALLGTLSLAPAQGEGLEFKNTRFTYGILGQTRESEKFLPGDVVCLLFDVQGMKVKDDGQVLYSMGFEVTKRGQKNAVQKREPQDLTAVNSLGGGNFPSFVYWPIPRDAEAPGEYTIKITVADRATKDKKPVVLTKTFEVVPTKLGFIQLRYTTFGGDPAPPVAVAGQRLALHYTLVGFATDKKENTSNVTVSIRVLDEKGKPTLAKPISNDIKSDAKAAPGVMLFNPFPIELNRAGKYKVELTAKCNVTGKDTKELIDLTVMEPK